MTGAAVSHVHSGGWPCTADSFAAVRVVVGTEQHDGWLLQLAAATCTDFFGAGHRPQRAQGCAETT